jgi:hypothetical protein
MSFPSSLRETQSLVKLNLGRNGSPRLTIQEVREHLRTAAASLGAAFRDLSNVETQTGKTSVSNTGDVAASVSEAASTLNDAFTELASIRDALSLRSGLDTVIRHAIDALAEAGVAGLTVTIDPGGTRLTVDKERLAASLDELIGDKTELGDTIDALLEGFTARLEDLPFAPAAEPLRRAALSDFAPDLKVDVSSSQIAATQLLLKSLLPAEPPATALKKASEAYKMFLEEDDRRDVGTLFEQLPDGLST